MFNAPVPPDTLVTRQIECISCKEVFTIAEDDAIRKYLRTDQWRLPIDHYPDTQLRYQPDKTRRSITPEARSQPALDPDQDLGRNHHRFDYVNCPRCGADNRNWLHIESSRSSGFIPLNVRQFPLVIIGYLVLVAILAVALFRHFDSGEIRRSLALIVAIFLAGLLPLLLIPAEWKRLREYVYLRRVATARPIVDISQPTRAGLLLFAIFVFLVPFVLFILIPWSFDKGVTLLIPEAEPTLVQRIDSISSELPAEIEPPRGAREEPARNAIASLEAMIDEQRFACEKPQIETMIARLQFLLTTNVSQHRAALIEDATESLQALNVVNQPICQPALVANAISNLEMLRALEEGLCRPRSGTDTLPSGCRLFLIEGMIRDLEGLQEPVQSPAGDPLDRAGTVLGEVRQLVQQSVDVAEVQRIESNVRALERFIEPEEQDWFNGSRDFLRNWVWLVGLTSLTSMITSLFAVDDYVHRVDKHLPRPIFYSLANMTRVVVWEAKRSLEIDGDMGHVHWTRVERSSNGGIILHGLCYDDFEPTQQVDPLLQKVRAQHYTISTDPWGRILLAEIRNVRAARPPQDQGPSIGSEFFQRVPVPPQREHISVS